MAGLCGPSSQQSAYPLYPTEQNDQTQNAQTDDDKIGEEKQFPVAVLIITGLVIAAIAAAAVVIVIVIKRKKRA